MATPSKPSFERRQSRLPGGFETDDDDLSPIKSQFDIQGEGSDVEKSPSQFKPSTQPSTEEDSRLFTYSEDGKSRLVGDDSILDDRVMQRKLMEMDSSFLPEISPAAKQSDSRADDTFVFGELHTDSDVKNSPPHSRSSSKSPKKESVESKKGNISRSSVTLPEMYRTPAAGLGKLAQLEDTDLDTDGDHRNTSSLETMSSSPAAAAAARSISRAASTASAEGYETANDANPTNDSDDGKAFEVDEKFESTPSKATPYLSPQPGSPTPTKSAYARKSDNEPSGQLEEGILQKTRKRPKFLKSRISSQRSSYSSFTTTSTETGSEMTLGADYALQSGGAIPIQGSSTSRPGDLSRTTSLGSMASGISTRSDEDKITAFSGALDRELGVLDEEELTSKSGVQTPKAAGRKLDSPTDTILAQRVKDVHVPPTVAREFRDQYRSPSPEKRNGIPPPSVSRHGKNLTLKEQSGTIDRLVKENFDLKLKVTFMDDLLNKRSEEGVKEIMSENINLRIGKVQAGKDIRELKRSIRELERKLKEKSDQLAETDSILKAERAKAGPSPEELQDLDLELTYLREKVMAYEVEMDRMAHENTVREGEKRRMAEVLKSMSERRGANSDIGVREEMVC